MRLPRRRVLLVMIAIVGAMLVAVAGYAGWLNWRLSQTIVSAPWRHPVEIVSAVRGVDSEPIARLYGDDWRVTEPVRIDEAARARSAGIRRGRRRAFLPPPRHRSVRPGARDGDERPQSRRDAGRQHHHAAAHQTEALLEPAHAAFPSLGNVPELHLISEVRNRRGRTIYRRKPRQERALDAPVAWLTHDLLRGVVTRGTASRLVDEGLDFVAGKTGTTTDYRDAWFVGYAPDLVTGLWIGCDGGAPLRLSAAEAAVPLWAAYMGRVRTSRAEIAPPEGIVFREIDPTNGQLWRPGCAGPVREAFLDGTEPETDCRGGGRTLLARLRGNPEPPEISKETWHRWSSEPIVRRRSTPQRVETGRDERPRFARRGGIPEVDEERERPRPRPVLRDERERERVAKRAEEWRKQEEKRFERLRKEQEKWRERVQKETEKHSATPPRVTSNAHARRPQR